jgi:hypothetical protein
MKKISDIFKRYKSIAPPDNLIKDVIIEVIEYTLSFTLTRKDISINKNTAYINTRSVIKREISFKKKEILQKINSKLEGRKIYTIM